MKKRYSSSRSLKGIGIAVVTAVAISSVTLPVSPLLAKAAPAHVAADLSAINVNDGFAELVKAVKPAVVNISVTGHVNSGQSNRGFGSQNPEFEEFFRRFFGEREGRNREDQNQNQNSQPYQRKTTAVGSGFIIDPSGLVVTNHHVVEDADEIEVVFDNGTRIPATLKGADSKTDLALLEIETDRPLPYVVFGDSEEAEVGDWVIAIGNPFGLGGTTTSGIISARGRDIRSGPLDDFIQVDASINRGNSGGPLFNTKGEVIGVNSAIYSPNGGSVGIGFAIPSSMANNVISQLRDNGLVQRGFLGVHIQSVSEEIAESLGLDEAKGALVTRVVEDSPAEDAGIEAGDIILSYDGKPIVKMRDLPKLVALTENNSKVNVEVWRNDEQVSFEVAIVSGGGTNLAATDSPGKSSNGKLGLALGKLDDQTLEKYGLDEDTNGVVIVDVVPDSSAAKRGLREGDVIKRVNKTSVNSPEDVNKEIEQTANSEKESVLLLVERDKQVRFVVVPMNS